MLVTFCTEYFLKWKHETRFAYSLFQLSLAIFPYHHRRHQLQLQTIHRPPIQRCAHHHHQPT